MITKITMDKDSLLEKARAIVNNLENGNEEDAYRVLNEITHLSEEGLFQEIGKLTRQLHDTINAFRVDSRLVELTSMTETEMPDARERLNYVIDMTAQAADQTLNAVELSLPVCDRLIQQSEVLHQSWNMFIQRKMSAEQFRELSKELNNYFLETDNDMKTLRSSFDEVLMAQGFQDITGQIIKRVIHLVEDVETKLVQLIKVSGNYAVPSDSSMPIEEKKKEDNTHGPVVPGVNDGAEVVSGQDEVDDLLSSLGF